MEGMKAIKMIEGMQGVSCYPGNLFYRFYLFNSYNPTPQQGEPA